MRVAVAASWSKVVRYKLSILVEKVFISFVSFARGQIFQVLLNLFIGFVEIVGARSRSRSVFLFVVDQIEVGVFAEAEIKLVESAFFLVDSLVPRVFGRVIGRGRQSFDHFDMIIHIEASPCDVVEVVFPFGSFEIFSFGDLFVGVEVLSDGLVLCIVPGDVSVGVISIYCGWREHRLGVIH